MHCEKFNLELYETTQSGSHWKHYKYVYTARAKKDKKCSFFFSGKSLNEFDLQNTEKLVYNRYINIHILRYVHNIEEQKHNSSNCIYPKCFVKQFIP